MARETLASLRERIAALEAAQASPSEASSHWKDRDIPCAAKPRCSQTFRTIKGRDWHIANVKHGK